jgi:hypothetical protein
VRAWRLIRATRYGREVRFAIEGRVLAEAQRFLATVERQWDDALNRLKRHVQG